MSIVNALYKNLLELRLVKAAMQATPKTCY